MDEERRHSDEEIDAILAELSRMETGQPRALESLQGSPAPRLSNKAEAAVTEAAPKAGALAELPNEKAALEEEQPEKKPRSWKQELWDWARAIALAVAAAVLVFGVLMRFVVVEGPSMEPTLMDGDRLVISGLFYQPDTGDIVVLSDKTGLGIPLIKRVIAVGGQDLNITADGQVVVDGVPLSEPYIAELADNPGAWDYPMTIPEGKVFVMGDNRNRSTDSRSERVGLVDEEEILGRVLLRVLPLMKFGPVK